METVKKRRRRKKAEEMTDLEAQALDHAEGMNGATVSQEELAMSASLRDQHDQNHAALIQVVVKALQAIPELNGAATANPAQVRRDVSEQRTQLEAVMKRVDDTLRDHKCPRPGRFVMDTGKILDQMKELRQCSINGTFTEETRQDMLDEKRNELSKAHRWESWQKAQEDLNKLREKCVKRLAANEAVAKEAKSGSDKKRLAARVASVKGLKAEEVDEASIVSTNVELPPEVTFQSFLYKAKFEKQYGVVIDRPDAGKGSGKGGTPAPPPKSLIVHGVNGEVSGCVAALKSLDLSKKEVLNVNARQASAIMGYEQSNARKLEEEFKGVFIRSERNQVTLYGPSKEVVACHKHVLANIPEEGKDGGASQPAPPPVMRVDKDCAKALIGEKGKTVQKIQTDTSTQIKVNLRKDDDDEETTCTVRITGDKANADKARDAINAFVKSLANCLVEAEPEVLTRLYSGSGKGKGKGGDGGGRQSRFAELRETSGLTVIRKTNGVKLLGNKGDVEKWKAVLKECVAEAGIIPTTVKVTPEQARLWSGERLEALKTASGARVQLIRRGKGGEASVLEISGSQEEKDKAMAEIETAHSQLSYSETIESVPGGATRALTAKGAGKTRDIERRHEVSISVDRKAQEVRILGDEEKVKQARLELESAIAAAGNTIRKEIEIEPEDAGIVIGKGGATVKSIRENSGIEDLQVETNSEQKKVVLRGSPEAVEAAAQLVAEVLARAHDPDRAEGGKGAGGSKGGGKEGGKGKGKGSGGKASDSAGGGDRREGGEGERRPRKGNEKGGKGKEKGDRNGDRTEQASGGGGGGGRGDWAGSQRKKQVMANIESQELFPSLGGPAAATRKSAGGAWGSKDAEAEAEEGAAAEEDAEAEAEEGAAAEEEPAAAQEEEEDKAEDDAGA